ncbi:MAG: hypothetical protein GY928_03015 [Colwellia sp.]|nr:hypothetical protein [Colwellia sp.]
MTVIHKALLYKMVHLNIPHKFIHWAKSFLRGRNNKVLFEGRYSRSRTFRAGVPQGSVISPLLFLIFINDITQQLPHNINYSLFADDLALWTSNPKITTTQQLQQAIDKIVTWTSENGLTTNKCTITLFTTDPSEVKQQPPITIGNNITPYTTNPKFLGITYDRLLTFNQHIKNIKAKAISRSNAIRAVAGHQ